jgi:hypothetical protein
MSALKGTIQEGRPYKAAEKHVNAQQPPEFLRDDNGGYCVQADWPGQDKEELAPAFYPDFAAEYVEAYERLWLLTYGRPRFAKVR